MVVELKAAPKQAMYTVTPTMAHHWAICGGFFAASKERSGERAASYALSLGTAVHELLVVYDRVPRPDAEAIATLVRRNWRTGRFDPPDDARAREEATRMLAVYHARRGAEEIEVLASECFIRTMPRSIGDGLLIALSGRIDRLGRRPNGTLEVLDFKTTAAPVLAP
jgi:RecB family exonuclease